ncbi:MAG: amidohydrolase family protein [Aggregatilineales bacterium]
MAKVQPITIQHAAVWNGHISEQRDLYFDERVLESPTSDALTIDLTGYTVFPGMVNAHDHLELNHYPRTKFREKYDNAHQWGEDVNARLNTEPYKSLRAYPLWDRCFIGGLKNLLCGATTVAHHGPPHKPLFRPNFPVRVLKKYGWAHSLHFNTESEVVASYRNTPHNFPWFIHLAEGTDEVAKSEYARLKALGCVGKKTVIVHGVGMTLEDIADAVQQVRGLVWCPSTNHYLLGETTKLISDWRQLGGYVAIGSDSRLTADGDFVEEALFARDESGCDVNCVEEAIRCHPAHILGLSDVGHLNIGARADLIVGEHRRKNLQLIIRGGIPQIGDPELMAKFPRTETVPATLDGIPKAINVNLARQIARCTLKEPGLELLEVPRRTLFGGVFSR